MKYDPKESVGKWDSGQKEILMKVLELSDSDLDNTRMWSKRLKYFFRDAVFADYDVRKISLEEWLKGAEEEFNENDWKDGDHPFSLDRSDYRTYVTSSDGNAWWTGCCIQRYSGSCGLRKHCFAALELWKTDCSSDLPVD